MQDGKSLDSIIEQQEKGYSPQGYDKYQEFYILYAISNFLLNIHSNDQVHGNMRLTNISLDEKYSPQVKFDQKEDESIKYLVSLSPEAIKQEQLTKESDIYSFGIIILQVLTHKINIFSDYSNESEVIKLLVKNNISPFNYSKSVPDRLSNILSLCFSGNKTKRPSAITIQSILKKILSEKNYEKQVNEKKKSIKSKKCSSNKKKKSISKKYSSNTKTTIPPSYKKIIERCWAAEPYERPSFQEILNLLKKQSEEEEEDNQECNEFKEEDINLIMQQSNVSRNRAISALREANGDLVTAVMNLAL